MFLGACFILFGGLLIEMNMKNAFCVIVWYTVFLVCSPVFLMAWLVYRLRGGSRNFTDWILYRARVEGKVKK